MRLANVGDYVFAEVVRPEGLEMCTKIRDGVVVAVYPNRTMLIKAPQGKYLCHSYTRVVFVSSKDLFGDMKKFVLKTRHSLERNK